MSERYNISKKKYHLISDMGIRHYQTLYTSMRSRRKFIRNTFIGGVAALQNQAFMSPATASAPVVISTWDFGKYANQVAWEILAAGRSSLDAVEQGVKVAEMDVNNQSVGYGGLPDRDGFVTLDACIMDHEGRCGSVAALENIVHAISVARAVMEKTPHVMLVGTGAYQFALANGFQKTNLLTPASEKAWKDWLKEARYQPVKNIENQLFRQDVQLLPGSKDNHDTIGMIALDQQQQISGACTTSGMAFKLRGRVGDSPIIGAGLYVDNEIGAATATGVGEEVIRIVGAHLVVELMRQGHSPAEACKKAVERIVQKNPKKAREIQVGFIALSRSGEYGAYALHAGFSYAVKNREQESIIEAEHFY